LELSRRLDDTEKRRAELRATIQNLRKRIREAEMVEARRMGGPTRTLTIQRRQLEMDLAARRARLEAMKNVLSRIAGQADEVGKALRELVAAREALAAGLEKEVAQSKRGPVDLLRARADLAEARLRAAEWGTGPVSARGGKLRDDVTGLEVDIAALEAQLKSLPVPPAEDEASAEDVQQLRAELVRGEGESSTLEMQYQQLRREVEQLGSPPALVTLDGNPG
jgi:chromosome segregation ATPase